MELVSKRVLILLCALFLSAATVEGVLLYKTHLDRHSEKSYSGYDISHPLAFRPNHVMRGIFPKYLFEDSFFKDEFPKENLFEESISFTDPKREDSGNTVKFVFDIKGHEKGNFDVKVSHGQLTLTAKDDQKIKEEKKGFWPWSKKDEQPAVSESHWSQTQSFPLPEDIDQKTFSVERKKDSFAVVFKKLG